MESTFHSKSNGILWFLIIEKIILSLILLHDEISIWPSNLSLRESTFHSASNGILEFLTIWQNNGISNSAAWRDINLSFKFKTHGNNFSFRVEWHTRIFDYRKNTFNQIICTWFLISLDFSCHLINYIPIWVESTCPSRHLDSNHGVERTYSY